MSHDHDLEGCPVCQGTGVVTRDGCVHKCYICNGNGEFADVDIHKVAKEVFARIDRTDAACDQIQHIEDALEDVLQLAALP